MANFLLDQPFSGPFLDTEWFPSDVFNKWNALQKIAQSEFQQGVEAFSGESVKDFISNPLEASGQRFPTVEPARIRTAGPWANLQTGTTEIHGGDLLSNPWGTEYGGYSRPGNPNFNPLESPQYVQYQTTLNPALQVQLSKDFWHSGAHPYHKGLIEAEMMPLASYQDPAYYYQRYNLAGRTLDAEHKFWKQNIGEATNLSSPKLRKQRIQLLDDRVSIRQAELEQKKQLAIEADMGHKRQVEIAKLRQVDPEFNATAQRLEQAARDLQQKMRGGNLDAKMRLMHELVTEFQNAYKGAQNAMAQKGLSVLQTGAPRMGYLMEGAGTASMIPDIARLVAGGDIAIGSNGLPFIASKAEMGAPSGVPTEGTPGEALWTQESDEENKARLAELDRSDKAMKSEKALRKQAYDYMVKNNPNRKVIEKQEQIKSSLQDWTDAYFK